MPTTDAQRAVSLRSANDIRLTRAQLVRELSEQSSSAGLRILATRLAYQDPILQTARIFKVLQMPHRFGEGRANDLLARASRSIPHGYIGGHRRIRTLSNRERVALVAMMFKKAEEIEAELRKNRARNRSAAA